MPQHFLLTRADKFGLLLLCFNLFAGPLLGYEFY